MSLYPANFKMFLALLLFLNLLHGSCCQTETTDQMLAKLLAPRTGCHTKAVADTYMNALSRRFTALDGKLEEVVLEAQSVELIIQAATGFNKTLNQLQDDLQTVKGRQAAAAAISVCQLLLVIVYLCVIGGIKIVKVFKKKQEKQLVANLELMESRLQKRKSKRRSAGRPPKEQ